MGEHYKLTEIFPNLHGVDASWERLTVTGVTLRREERRMELCLLPDAALTPEVCRAVCAALEAAYGLAAADVAAPAAPELFSWLSERLGALTPMAAGLLAGARIDENGTVRMAAATLPLLTPFLPQLQEDWSAAGGGELRVAAAEPDEDELRERAERLRREALSQKPAVSAPGPKKRRRVLMGHEIKRKAVTKMSDLALDMGLCLVEGEVFEVTSRELKKRRAWMLSFAMTDRTGSVRVTKFLEANEGRAIVPKIKEKQYLRVQGRMRDDRFLNDMVLEPENIMEWSREAARKDTYEGEKRVELHLHTTMSNMDALTDTTEVIKRAASWGHRAVAITDHGVVQSFPEAFEAGKKNKIKILYGMEAYFVNDVDDRLVVHGDADEPLAGEFVCFDIETTGLRYWKDEITEIGAVVLRNGEVAERFQTFVNPGRPLTMEIMQLTGITDAMLRDAPKPAEAVSSFLQFVNGRPLAAHNAEFDVSFIRETCRRMGRPFDLTSLDTLILAQNLLPGLPRYRLDNVAEYLSLPAFNHHRAVDDAATVAYMLPPLFKRLREKNVGRLQEINSAMRTLRSAGKASRYPRHMTILVRDQVGLRNLYKLVSLSHLEHFRRVPIIPKSLLLQNREGLLLGSACENGELYSAIVSRKDEGELRRIAAFYDFLEIQPVCNNDFLVRNGRVESHDKLRELNRLVVELGRALGKPVAATGDVHFLDPEDEQYRHILLAAKEFDDADKPLPLYFRTTDEMLQEFSYLGEEAAYQVVVRDPNRIADLCGDVRPLPVGLFAPKLDGSVEELETLVWTKAKRLYGEKLPELVRKRLESELHDIISSQYEVIYMSAQKLVQKSLDDGYLVGSRGSVGSSLVAYMSGITEVNALPPHYRCPKCHNTEFVTDGAYGCGADMPDKNCPLCGALYEKDGFDIPFETFLGFGGDKVPDIDLNFSGEYQAKAHKHTEELFGKEHVFRAGTIGTVALKTAFGYVKKYLEGRGKTVSRAEELRLAMGCVGVRRTTGQHPGGLVVIPQDHEVYDFCPVQHPADDTDSETITTHFDYHKMEENLLKLDMLGHDDPTMIRMLQDLTGVDPLGIRLDDPETMGIFTSSKVLGYENDPILGPTGACAIPEFGTRFVRGMLQDTQPKQFDILVRLSGFSHGTDVWLGNAKDYLESGVATVRELIGCRDDIMLYLIARGMDERRAFKFMETVRKGAIHKGKPWPEGIEDEMRSLGVPQWYVDSCRKIKYLFPKAHAVAYVMMAFRIAWYKVHKPVAFYAAYFTIRAKAFDAAVMTRGMDEVLARMRALEAKENPSATEEDMLVTLEVCYEFYLRGFHFESLDLRLSDATRFLPVGEDGLRPPFVAVAGLGETAARDIVEHRGSGDFISVEEFSRACPKVSRTHIEQLRLLGGLGDLPDSAQVSLF
ncbi:MAG TPA: PolC-type DNA polymerase III [Oscillospiraceae bacterium]|nr:PolC-type DNA polymerase III [Oscillospiraceae bacterium]